MILHRNRKRFPSQSSFQAIQRYISNILFSAERWNSTVFVSPEYHHNLLYIYIYIYIYTCTKRINREARKVAKNFNVNDRVDTMKKQECFIILKDHKEDYRTNPKYHLLNPTKCQLGKISKQISQKINKILKSKLNLNQGQNSSEVIDWFKNIQQKSSHTCSL